MALSLRNQSVDPESGNDGQEQFGAAPVSGVRQALRPTYFDEILPDDREDPDFFVPVDSGFVVEVPATDDVPEKPQTASWISELLKKAKAAITAPPVKPVVKEFIPQDEQRNIDLLKIEEEGLVIFENILENRELLRLNALAAGMAPSDIEKTDQLALDPGFTKIWEKRVEDKRRLVSDLRSLVEQQRIARSARASAHPRPLNGAGAKEGSSF